MKHTIDNDTQIKMEAYRKCYPMITDKDDSLYYATWNTFSYIWDLVIGSTTAVPRLPI